MLAGVTLRTPFRKLPFLEISNLNNFEIALLLQKLKPYYKVFYGKFEDLA